MQGPATMFAASTAADAQTQAANTASQTQMAMFNKMQQDLQPYMDLGQSGINGLTSNLSSLTSPVSMTQSDLEKTPGYQFQLSQGLKSTQNQQAAEGLGVSGASQKAAANYATGLANSNYQQQFQNQVTNQTNQFNRLMGITDIGQASAAGVGAAGVSTGNNIASNTMGAANATAASTMSMANAAGNTGNNALTAYFMSKED